MRLGGSDGGQRKRWVRREERGKEREREMYSEGERMKQRERERERERNAAYLTNGLGNNVLFLFHLFLVLFESLVTLLLHNRYRQYSWYSALAV